LISVSIDLTVYTADLDREPYGSRALKGRQRYVKRAGLGAAFEARNITKQRQGAANQGGVPVALSKEKPG